METTQTTTASVAQALVDAGFNVEFVVNCFGSKHCGSKTNDFTRLGELERELEVEGFSKQSIGIRILDRLYAVPEALTLALGTEMKTLGMIGYETRWWVPQPNLMVSLYAGVISVMEF